MATQEDMYRGSQKTAERIEKANELLANAILGTNQKRVKQPLHAKIDEKRSTDCR